MGYILRRKLLLIQLHSDETILPVFQHQKTILWMMNVKAFSLKLLNSRRWLTGVLTQISQWLATVSLLQETFLLVFLLLRRKTMICMTNVKVFLPKQLSSKRWLIGITIQTNQWLVMASLQVVITSLALRHLSTTRTRKKSTNVSLRTLRNSRKSLNGITTLLSLSSPTLLSPVTTSLVHPHLYKILKRMNRETRFLLMHWS